jgi:hypothetical protein
MQARACYQHCAPLMSAPRPNLFLIGSMKSGTTYLSELLGGHPEVFMSSPKEPCHFVDQKVLRRVWRDMWEQGYWRSEDRYLSLFAMAGEAKVIAEASTAYSKVPRFAQVPERILNFNPQARFIYIMRDPVERAISHYWHRVRWWRERRSMLVALRSDPQYLEVSYYALQLSAYLRHVARNRIYVLTLEELLADPAEQIARVYDWLGIASSFRPANIGIPTNVRPEAFDQVRGLGLLDAVRRSAWFRSVSPHLPRAVRKLGSTLAARSVRPAEVSEAAVRDYLRPMQLRQTEELSSTLNRTFPEWKTLYAESRNRMVPARVVQRQLAESSDT